MPFVLLDTDGVVVDYDGNLRPGVREVMSGLIAMGWTIKMWSGNGSRHALEVAKQFDLPCKSFTTKPEYPMTRESVVKAMKGVPAIQFDDDATEYVGDWPFLLVTCKGKMPGRTAKA